MEYQIYEVMVGGMEKKNKAGRGMRSGGEWMLHSKQCVKERLTDEVILAHG